MDCFHCLMRVWSETSDHQDEHMLYEFAYILIFQPMFFFIFKRSLNARNVQSLNSEGMFLAGKYLVHIFSGSQHPLLVSLHSMAVLVGRTK